MRARSRGALCLAEVVFAAALLASAAVPLAACLVDDSRFARRTRESVVAERLAADVLERLRQERPEDLADLLATPAAARAWLAADQVLGGGEGPPASAAYLRRFACTARLEPAQPGSPGCRLLRVEVRWTEQGRPREVSTCVVLAGGR